MEGSRQNKTADAQTEQTGTHLRDGAIVNLFSEAQSSKEECHAEDQQKIGQNRTEEGGLNDADLILCQSNDEDDQFNSITKGNVEKGANCVTKLSGHRFGGVAQKASQRNNGNSIDGENGTRGHARHIGHGDSHRNSKQQNVEPAMTDDFHGGSVESYGHIRPGLRFYDSPRPLRFRCLTSCGAVMLCVVGGVCLVAVLLVAVAVAVYSVGRCTCSNIVANTIFLTCGLLSFLAYRKRRGCCGASMRVCSSP